MYVCMYMYVVWFLFCLLIWKKFWKNFFTVLRRGKLKVSLSNESMSAYVAGHVQYLYSYIYSRGQWH